MRDFRSNQDSLNMKYKLLLYLKLPSIYITSLMELNSDLIDNENMCLCSWLGE